MEGGRGNWLENFSQSCERKRFPVQKKKYFQRSIFFTRQVAAVFPVTFLLALGGFDSPESPCENTFNLVKSWRCFGNFGFRETRCQCQKREYSRTLGKLRQKLLDAFRKLLRDGVLALLYLSLLSSVYPHGTTSSSTERIFMKSDIWQFF
jgi:hypothetical protein